MHRHDIYSLTHTSPVVGRDLISNITTAHIASIGVGTMLIASTYTGAHSSLSVWWEVVHMKLHVLLLAMIQSRMVMHR